MKKLVNLFKIKSLKWQLLFRMISIFIILLVVMGTFVNISMKKYLYATKTQVLQQKFHNLDFAKLSKVNVNDIAEDESKEILNRLKDKRMSIALIDDKGNHVLTLRNSDNISEEYIEENRNINEYAEKKVPSIPVPIMDKSEYADIRLTEGNLEKIYEIVEDENGNYQMVVWRKVGDLNSPTGLIQLSTTIDDIVAISNREIYVHASISVLIVVVGMILGTAVFNRTLKPLNDMTDTVEKIDASELDKRLLEENGQLEIDRLAKSFNFMLERIEISFEEEQHIKEKMRRFISDASHELKTPLTSIHGFVEILLRGAAKNEDQLNLALNSILIESERLTQLVNDLLMLTKLDQHPEVDRNIENVKNIIEEVLPGLEILAKERKIQLDLQDDVVININKNQIKQVIFNLVQNAILHTDSKEGVITISTSKEELNSETYSALKIADNGTGIPKKDLDKIYDRFFRSESHRSREKGGYGLGLSIVKSIIDNNNGEIRVESEVGVGTTFSIYFKD